MLKLCKFTKIHSTVYGGRLLGDKYPKYSCYGWREMEELNCMNIIKIQCGHAHSLHLDSTEVVWSAGCIDDGECGLGDSNESVTSTEIENFKDRKIRIQDVATDCYHNLAVDENRKIHAWGYNFRYQCGDGSLESVLEP